MLHSYRPELAHWRTGWLVDSSPAREAGRHISMQSLQFVTVSVVFHGVGIAQYEFAAEYLNVNTCPYT